MALKPWGKVSNVEAENQANVIKYHVYSSDTSHQVESKVHSSDQVESNVHSLYTLDQV